MSLQERKVGKHDFYGSYSPQGGTHCFGGQQTFSVGCFQWLARPTRYVHLGPRCGTVKVRVSGPVGKQDQVEAKAREICAQLDAGTYAGPKNVKVK